MKVLIMIAMAPALMLAHSKKAAPNRGRYANCPISVYSIYPYMPGEGDTTVVQFRNMSSKSVKALEGRMFTKDAFGNYHDAGGVEWEPFNGKPLKPQKTDDWKMYNYIWYGKPGHMGFKLTKLLFSDGTQWKPDPACEWTGPVFVEINR